MGSNPQDFIAEDDIFIDAQGKVVEKKDARTKLASKGARVSPEDVERYGLKKPAAPVVSSASETHKSSAPKAGTVLTTPEKPSATKKKQTEGKAGE